MMIHQPLGGFQGQASDIAIHAKEILLVRDKLNTILAKHTGQPIDKVALDTERDNFMSGEEAVAYGLVDEVLASRLDKAARAEPSRTFVAAKPHFNSAGDGRHKSKTVVV